MTHQETASKVQLRPLGNRVLLKAAQAEESLKGGIILPDSAKKKREMAFVVAVGPGATTKDGKLLPMSVKVGDKVLMDKYAGQEITLDDEEYIILRDDDIIAIVN